MIDYDVGDLVVCVDDRRCAITSAPCLVKRGTVYTVVQFLGDDAAGRLCVQLAEIAAPGTLGFVAGRFRKLPKKSQAFFAGENQRVPVEVAA